MQKEADQKEDTGKKRKSKKSLIVWIVAIVMLVGSVAAALHYKNEADRVKANPSAVQSQQNQAETDRVIAALKTVLLVQESEAPTVARVENPETLKASNELFYKNVEVGDYLIIYPSRAVIYRESINQIINIAPIVNETDGVANQPGAVPTE